MLNLGSSSISIILLSLLLLPYFPVENIQVHATVPLPKNVKLPAIFAFGDSIVDPGNNNNLPTLGRSNFPPYGKDFMGGRPTGRFSNGKIPTDLLVEALGIKKFLPAYNDPSLKPEDLLTGVSFASGGSGLDPFTAQLLGVIGLPEQLEMFKECIRKLKATTGEERTASILKDSGYFLVAGSNDLSINYFDTTFRRSIYDIPSYTDFLVQKATSFIQELYDLGARRIGIFSAPPVGCLPGQRTLAGNIERRCQDIENQAAILYNSKLFSALQGLRNKLRGGKVTYIDIYNPLLDIIKYPTRYGFEVADKGCCGTGNIEVAILCNALEPTTCQNVSNYVFWDTYHPTQKTYQVLVEMLLKKYLDVFF